jgi:hypothetical protein
MTAMGVIASCFKLLDSHKYISRLDIREMCAKLHMDTYKVLEIWPEEHNDDFKERMKSILLLRKWGEYLDRNPDKLKSQTIVFIAGRLKEDLRMITRNKRKLKLLEYLDEPLDTLQKYVDATGWHHAACDEGNEMLDFLYDLIEWDWEKMRRVIPCPAV